MELTQLNIPEKKIKILENKQINSVEELLYSRPNKYLFFNKIYALNGSKDLFDCINNRIPIAIIGTLNRVDSSYTNGKSIVKLRIKDSNSENSLYVNAMGEFRKLEYYKSIINKTVIIGGVIRYNEPFYGLNNILLFSTNIEENIKIFPVYKKYKGISEDYYKEVISKAIDQIGDKEIIPSWIIKKYNLCDYSTTLKNIHTPKDKNQIISAENRITFENLLYFTCKLEEKKRNNISKSNVIIKNTNITEEMLSCLPFKLTNGQHNAIFSSIDKMKNGHKVSALVQGDVGSGKTMVAFGLMFAMAENNYQAILMAPTTVLATQHYKELKDKGEKYGFKVALLSNELTNKEKKTVLKDIKEGNVNLIVGTHSLISKSVEYHNLGLIITDEEHKFGVLQRETLINKTNAGIHNIIMSGTPIPRTLANTLYGTCTDVYNMELPNGRQPIQTAICKGNKPIFEFLLKQIKLGRQGYVVCPLIEKAEEESKMNGVSSIEETYKEYKQFFEQYNINIGIITGKTSKEEQSQIMTDYKNNKIQILMATTVIEVGVNNPNATVIVITGAERFGLATLHQLRGRVGRGQYQSYCILQKSSEAKTSNNMEILCSTNDGFEIAKADLHNRGSGNIIGIEQSGKNKYVDLMLLYPRLYESTQKIAQVVCNRNESKAFINAYEEYYIS